VPSRTTPRLEGALARRQELLALLCEPLADSVADRIAADAEPPGEETQDDDVLRALGSGRLAGDVADRHGDDLCGRHAVER
jgi:hypothetical protein